MRARFALVTASALATLILSGCGGSSTSTPPSGSGPASGNQTNASQASLNKNDYPVFPDADSGADPAVPAAQGGKGFTGDGWQTNTTYDLVGDPRALKGGVLKQALSDFPVTLRQFGPESNTVFNAYILRKLVYEPLLWLNPTTLDFVPALATHWQISPDKMTYRFRINPNARWSDGEPVTADDVVATWDLIMDKTLEDPMDKIVFEKFERPIAESKYIVRVKSKELNWRNFLYFATGEGMVIFPAHVLKNVDGKTYQRDYNFKVLPGTGPYELRDSDVSKGNTITLRRRPNYWAAKHRRSVGIGNFDQLAFTIYRDDNLKFEAFKKGDFDLHYENVSRRWTQEMNTDRFQRGLIQRTKIYNDNPSGIYGLAFNTRKAPFDDVRVRQALALLLNREQLIKNLFFNEYPPLNSYFAGGIYENRDDPKMPYDPQKALELLAAAGFTGRDAQGRLTRNGQPLVVELLNSDKGSERWLTVYQDDLRKVGVTLNLRLVTPETAFKLMMERKFDLADIAWGAETFPNPETEFSSSLADIPNNNNITGIKDKRIDELLKQYDLEFDQHKREGIIREVDGILANLHHYILLWDAPFQRIAYWNKFGHPPGYISRIDDYYSASWLWWSDPATEQKLRQSMADPSVKLPIVPLEDRYWLDQDRTAPGSSGGTGSVTK